MDHNDSSARYITDTVDTIGCQDLTLDDGAPLHLCEAGNLISSFMTGGAEPGPDSMIALVAYRDARPNGSPAHGYLVQLSPASAREIGASLIEMADKIDPKGTH